MTEVTVVLDCAMPPMRKIDTRRAQAAFAVLAVIALVAILIPSTAVHAAAPNPTWGPSGGASIPAVVDASSPTVASSPDGTKVVAAWADAVNPLQVWVVAGTVAYGNAQWGSPQATLASNPVANMELIMVDDSAVLVWQQQNQVDFRGTLVAAAISADFGTRTVVVDDTKTITSDDSVTIPNFGLGFNVGAGRDTGSGALVATAVWNWQLDPNNFYPKRIYSTSFSVQGGSIDASGADSLVATVTTGAALPWGTPQISVSSDGSRAVTTFNRHAPDGLYRISASAGEIQGGVSAPVATWQTAPSDVSTNTGMNNAGEAADVVIGASGLRATVLYVADVNGTVQARSGQVSYSGAGSSIAWGTPSAALGVTNNQMPVQLVGSTDGTRVLGTWTPFGNPEFVFGDIDDTMNPGWDAETVTGAQNQNFMPALMISADGTRGAAAWVGRDSSFAYVALAATVNLDGSAPPPQQEWSPSEVVSTPGVLSNSQGQIVGAQVGSAQNYTAVWALNSGGISSSSTPYVTVPLTPGAPVASNGNGQSTVTVTPAGSGTTPTSYTVTSSPGGQTCTVNGASGSCTVPSLNNGTAYTFTSVANYFTLVSGVSPASNSITPAQGPTISSQPADDTRNVGQTATFAVTASGTGSLSYQWERLPAGGSWANVSGGSGALTASYTTPTLVSGDDSAQYRVVITDVNGPTTSNAATLRVITPPGAPNQPTVTSVGNGSATISVSAGAGGAPTSYTVTPSPLPASAPTTCSVTPPASTCSFSNLTNGTAYTFSATATNQAGTSVASSSSSSVTPLAPPGQPGAPTAAVTGATSATVTITAPGSGGPPATYTVTPSPAPGSAPTTCTVTAPATSCAFSNLTNGTTYTFTSTATNVGGTSSASPASASTQIAAPGTPGTPTAVAGPAQGTVTVTAPSSGGPAATYTVTSNPAGGTCTVTSPATSCIVSGLTPGTAYTFTATATNGAGTSGPSSASNSVTPTANVAPGTPGTPTAVASNGGATVTVVAPGSGGSPTSYTVTPSPLPASAPTTCTVTVPATTCSFSNLTNGTAYTFTSTATNGAGTSGASSASTPITPLAAPGAPGQPTAVVASATSATVTITPPTSGGAPATYLVTSSPGAATCTVTAPATSCTVTGLTSGQTYTFSSTATNVGGTSGSSPASASITLGAPGVPGTPSALAGAGLATVSITPPGSGGTPSSYTVTSSPGGGTCTVTPPATSCVVLGLTAGTPYTFTSTASNSAGTSGSSAVSNAVTPTSPTPPTPPTPVPPSAPAAVSVVAGNGSTTVSWVAPTNPGSFAVTQYRAVASPGGASCLVPAPATSCVIPGLTNGITYTVAVSALSGAGWGAAATSSPVTPGSPAPTTPSVIAVLAGNGAATVTVGAGSGGGPVTSYLVVASPGGATCTVAVSASTCVVTGLTNGTAYTFTASATGPGGTSGSSAGSGTVTPVAPITPTPAPLPAPLAPGQSSLQVGGQASPVTVTPNAQSNAALITAPGFSMLLQGENDERLPLPLSDGVLVLEQDRTLRTAGSGFFPNTNVVLYLDPPTIGNGSMLRAQAGGTLLGSVATDALGDFDGRVQLDPGVGVGDHVVQAVGVTQGNVERAIALGVRVVEVAAKRPGPVRDLAVVKKRTTSVTVTWRPPVNDGGSAVTKYKVLWRTKDEGRYRNRTSVTPTTYTIRNLEAGEIYYIRVRSVNSVGTGPSDRLVKVRLPKG